MSGSASVTSRENGAVHEMLIDEVLLFVTKSLTDASGPARMQHECKVDFAQGGGQVPITNHSVGGGGSNNCHMQQ